MFPKKNRINKRLFDDIIKNGSSIHGSFFVFKFLKNPKIKDFDPNKNFYISCVAPKSMVKSAVLRNKFKRKAYCAIKPLKIKGFAGIFIYKKGGLLIKTPDLTNDIYKIFTKAGFISK